MKKMFLVAAASIIASVSFSQVKFGFQVIGNASTSSFKIEEIEGGKKTMQTGFGAGVAAEFPIKNNVSIRSSVNFLQKKSALEFKIPLMPEKIQKVTNTLNYIELPVNFVYTIPMKSMSVYFGAGPSFGYGIGGTAKIKGWDFEDEDGQVIVPFEMTLKPFKKDEEGDALKRFEVSANVNAGLQFNNGLYINAGYLAGLSNIGDSEQSFKNRGILLTVGFQLGGRK